MEGGIRGVNCKRPRTGEIHDPFQELEEGTWLEDKTETKYSMRGFGVRPDQAQLHRPACEILPLS